MRWNQLYALRSYLRSSLWIVPFISLLLYILVIRLVYAVDREVAWQPPVAWGVLGTQSILETIITLMLTFIVFTFGSLLVAIQVAGGQLTPRIVATTLLRDNSIRFTVGLFTFTLLFATGVLARLDTTVPPGIEIHRGPAWFLFHRGVSLSDRLRGAAAWPRQHYLACWGTGAGRNRERLPGTA